MLRMISALCIAAASTCAAHAQPSVKIGVILEFTGQFADAATQIDNGIRLYMKEHGDTVAGRKIEVVRRDTGGIAPDVAKRLAQELVVRERVDVLAGFATTPNNLAAADISAEAKKFMVIMNAATSLNTTRSPYSARVSYTISQVAAPLAPWAYKNGVRKAYTLVLDLGPGHDAEQEFQRRFKELGGEIVGSVRFPIANPDFAAFVQRAKDVNPDGLFVFVPGGAQPAALGKALAERGIDARKTMVIGNDVMTEESALKAMGDAALGIVTGANYDHNLDNPKNRAFVKAYQAAYNRPPDLFSAGGYDGMHLIYESLKKTGGKTDGDSLIGAAKGMQWDSPRGPMSIDPETRDVVQSVYIRRVERSGGRLANVTVERFENVKDPVKERARK